MNVVSDADFNEDYPAGILLNDIVFQEYRYQNIGEQLASQPMALPFSSLIAFELRGTPALDTTHRLTFEFGLSSGDILTVSTGSIDFASL